MAVWYPSFAGQKFHRWSFKCPADTKEARFLKELTSFQSQT